jgi:ABC-type nitrate/sulfonate/bicarbonate transport system substrate-binding protein
MMDRELLLQRSPRERRRGGSGRVAGVLLATSALLCACGTATPAGSAVNSATPSPTFTAAPTVPVSAPAASATPAPTASLPPAATPTPTAAVSPSPSASPSASTSAPSAEPVRLALDWTPNTNHTGFFVAQAKGWYADAGVALKVMPYTDTAPETLLTAGQADCGISFQDSLTFAVAAGAPITSVMAILQHTASAIAVLGDGPIKRPRDLDGRVYGGFGYPADDPTIRAIIRHDGGKGTFTDATLNAGAYQALYAKQVDFTIVFTAWEGIEAQEKGINLRYFRPVDYGFPDSYQVVLACNRDWLAHNGDLARRFVGATVKGFDFAVTDPAHAAEILISENPGIFDAHPELARDSAAYLTLTGLYVNEAGLVGPQTLERWTAYSGFLYKAGILTGPNGKPLTAPPDYASLFTNAFLPGGP